MRFVCGCCLIIAATTPAFAQRGLKDIPAPDPAAELSAMRVADGYEVSLFAADPLISKPLQINFDTQGRLWVSSSSVYPQIRPGEVANDTVTILEDRDGDGRADAHTTFADGLLMPTAVLPDDGGGAFIANSTELLHCVDRDGDGRADERRVVLSGFGAEDTHHIIHTFRRGPDARVYFNQSIYIHSHVETPRGVRRLNGGGIWRFEPESLALDVFARGWVNTWGHVFDAWGRSLTTDGAGGEGIYYAFPGAAYQAAVGTPRILHGMNPGSPKYCGLEIIDGRHLPDDAQGVLVTNDFRANRVCRFRLTEAGSGFTSEKLPDLIHSSRVTFRPIDVKMGPDGAIYIADWYNPIIQHGEVDFRDPRRDREHGRIWRVTAKGRPLVPRIDFRSLATADLFHHLAAPESYARDMARRELFSRGDAVRADVDRWLASLDQATANVERLRLEGLRLKQGLDRGSAGDVDLPLLKAVLASPDSRARAAAARILVDWANRIEQPAELLAAAVDDPAPQVRLEAVRALAALGGQRAAELALHAVDHERDAFLDYSAWLTARDLRDAWLPAVVAGTFDDGGKPARVIFAARAAEAQQAVPWLVARVQDGKLSAADRRQAFEAIAALGGPADLRLVFDQAIAPATKPAQAAALLKLLVETETRRRVRPAGDLAAITRLLESPDPAVVMSAINACAAWKIKAALAPLAAMTHDTARSAAQRRAAIGALGGLPGDEARETLVALASGRDAAEEDRAAAITALVAQWPDAAARQAATFLNAASDAKALDAVFRGFLATKAAATTLATVIDAEKLALPAGAVQAGRQAISSAGRQEPELEQALAAAGTRFGDSTTSVAGRHAMSGAELDAFVDLVRTKADPARGEAIFRREALKCVTCHRVGDHGPRVGPNLAAIGAASPLDYIIDSLVYPAKNVKEGYQTLVVLTDDGRVVTGIQVSRSDEELVLRDALDREVRVPTAEIDEESIGTSLMPAGLIDPLSREELADLVRYLAGLGK
jgi:putative heme-binding domain-containing protein